MLSTRRGSSIQLWRLRSLHKRLTGFYAAPNQTVFEALRKSSSCYGYGSRSSSTFTFASLTSKIHHLNFIGNDSPRFYFYPGGSFSSLLASILMVTFGSLLVFTNELQPSAKDKSVALHTDVNVGGKGISHLYNSMLRNHRNFSLQNASCASSSSASVLTEQQQQQRRRQLLRSRQTVRKMEEDSSSDLLTDRYNVNWKQPLGEGSFGVVYLGIDKRSGERVAVKKISKKYTGAHDLQREMHALLYLRDAGGHPNICSLRENFSEDGYYYLILDLIEGCEMFDHLVSQGAYSEADAARLVSFFF